MIVNYLQSATRNFRRNKLYSLINAFGLSIAIAFSLLVFLFVQDEHNFDSFHERRSQIHRINLKRIKGPALQTPDSDPYGYSSILPNGLGVAIRELAMEADRVTLIKQGGERPVSFQGKALMEEVHFADSSFLKMFSFNVVSGSTHQALSNPTDAVITPEVASRIFGDEDPIGKTIVLDYEQLVSTAFTVSAVVACPQNSSVQFEVLLPIEAYKPYQKKSWNLSSYSIFVQLSPEADPKAFESKINGFIQTHRADWIKQQRDYLNLPADVPVESYTLTALEDVHFDKKVPWTNVSDAKYSWILSSMALLIILIASINYVSFSLMLSSYRNKEIGIRKTVGATINQIFTQFSLESIGNCVAASLMGVLLAVGALPLFNYFVQKKIHFADIQVLPVMIFLCAVTLTVGLLAGGYPSFLLSRLRPAFALRGSVLRQPYFVRPLVVMQFVMSAFLIIASMIMYRQMNYVMTKDLGFSGDRVMVIPTNLGWSVDSDIAIERFRAATENSVDILGVSGASGSFIQGSFRKTFKEAGMEHLVYFCRVDPHYIPLLNIELKEGRNFNSAEDSLSILVNEALVNDMGWTHPLQETYKPDGPDSRGYRVIGVMKGYHFLSLEQEIQPIFLSASSTTGSHLITLLVKINGENIPRALAYVQKTWKELYPDKPFEYSFAEDELAQQYEAYLRWTHLSGIAALLAGLIAALGMFGIAGISAVARTKEIAVRKVLGADLTGIFLLLNRPFLLMAVVAFLIAVPGTWYLMTTWIANFRYHISISWEIFLIGMISGLLVALIAVSYHGWKTSHLNPAEALRSE